MRSIEVLRRPRRPATTRTETREVVLDELGSALFASLPRRDQREKGLDYIRGLLETEGRKSIRNIALQLGTAAAEQSLHHFISDSTWDWNPVRLALARYLLQTAPPQAWVVQPAIIPKAGAHSVGVGRQFSPDIGQALNAQQAVGVWAASEEMTGPVDWRLRLSREWVDDAERRDRASIPAGLGPESVGDCVVEAFLSAQARHELPGLPVVLDARGADAGAMIHRLRSAGVPVLARISNTHRLVVDDPTIPSHCAGPVMAHQIMGAAHRLRRPTSVSHRGPAGTARIDLTAVIRVRGTGAPHDTGPLALLGTGPASRPWPAELWLPALVDTAPAELARLTKLIRRVDHDFATTTDDVGIRDFAGRSFTGWHRHATLASAAHAVALLAGTTRTHRPMAVRTA